MSDLRACPFCGGEVEIMPEGDFYEIRCDDCQLSMWAEKKEDLENTWNKGV